MLYVSYKLGHVTAIPQHEKYSIIIEIVIIAETRRNMAEHNEVAFTM